LKIFWQKISPKSPECKELLGKKADDCLPLIKYTFMKINCSLSLFSRDLKSSLNLNIETQSKGFANLNLPDSTIEFDMSSDLKSFDGNDDNDSALGDGITESLTLPRHIRESATNQNNKVSKIIEKIKKNLFFSSFLNNFSIQFHFLLRLWILNPMKAFILSLWKFPKQEVVKTK
jgi:hypothetical protein